MVIVLKNVILIYIYLYLVHGIIFLDIDVLLFNNKEKVNDIADSVAVVKKIILNDVGEGYKPAIPSIDILKVCMYVPANAGPIAIPMNESRAPIAVDIPINSLGAEETIKFQIAVIVSASPIAIIVRFIDTKSPVECSINKPISPAMLIAPPNTVGIIFPSLDIR